ncbi:polyamine ABC transporter ATP-binding protein [Neisseria gonorrhoeae]|nr:polyamine ABC transporter ATP-binding protein [Neisseria gonorrhoeae]QOG41893.1 polyamine ABC transporter ATP-binding protein [Neisseria gonorrhoeae]
MNLNKLKNKLFRRPGQRAVIAVPYMPPTWDETVYIHLTVIAVTYTPPTWDETVYISWPENQPTPLFR